MCFFPCLIPWLLSRFLLILFAYNTPPFGALTFLPFITLRPFMPPVQMVPSRVWPFMFPPCYFPIRLFFLCFLIATMWLLWTSMGPTYSAVLLLNFAF